MLRTASLISSPTACRHELRSRPLEPHRARVLSPRPPAQSAFITAVNSLGKRVVTVEKCNLMKQYFLTLPLTYGRLSLYSLRNTRGDGQDFSAHTSASIDKTCADQ